MPTQVMFERQLKDVLGAVPEADLHTPHAAAPNAIRLDVELSLHHDFTSVEAD